MVTNNKEMLLACSYFDLSHCGYFEAKVDIKIDSRYLDRQQISRQMVDTQNLDREQISRQMVITQNLDREQISRQIVDIQLGGQQISIQVYRIVLFKSLRNSKRRKKGNFTSKSISNKIKLCGGGGQHYLVSNKISTLQFHSLGLFTISK